MIAVIDPVSPSHFRHFLASRQPEANFRGLQVHAFHGLECAPLLDEIGRIRELGFRAAGAGRGLNRDLDELDTDPLGYEQLVAWDPEREEIAALLRFQMGQRAVQGGLRLLRTHRLFEYEQSFTTSVLPVAMELGRSLIHPAARRARLGLYALWQGLARVVLERRITTLFGNVTLYANYPTAAKQALVAEVEGLYQGATSPLRARPGLRFLGAASRVCGAMGDATGSSAETRDPELVGLSGKEKLRRVKAAVTALGSPIPTMLQSYLQLGPEVVCGETVCDADFGNALELGIVVPRAAIAATWGVAFGLHGAR